MPPPGLTWPSHAVYYSIVRDRIVDLVHGGIYNYIQEQL